MMTPKISRPVIKSTVSFVVPVATKEQLYENARANRVSLSSYIATLVEFGLRQQETEETISDQIPDPY